MQNVLMMMPKNLFELKFLWYNSLHDFDQSIWFDILCSRVLQWGYLVQSGR